MKFALAIPISHINPPGEFQSGAAVREIAAAFERAGLCGACLSEHPAPSAEWLHNDVTGHDSLDPLTGLAFVAAATTSLKVITNVVVLPYRNPFLTAKAAATLQVLSDNRLVLGVGVGYQEVEFEALGIPYAQRGALTDEALETMALAWAGGKVVKKGRFFNAVGNEPRPAPAVPPPIWVGGGSDKSVERAARWGDGWAPYFSVHAAGTMSRAHSVESMQHFSEKAQTLHELRDKLGKTKPFDLAVGSPFRPKNASRSDAEQFVELARELQSRGATWVWSVLPAPSRAGYLDNVAWFGEEIVGAFVKQ